MLKYVKMQRGDEIADVADIEIEIWQAAGFEVTTDANGKTVFETETEAQTETKTQTPVRRRDRPRKVS